MPDPILIGRNAEKIEALAKAHGIARWGTDLDAALANQDDTVFFDAGTTQMRPTLLAKAMRAGKHVYCEKPIATNLNEAVEICAPGAGLGPEARRGAGQAVPARPAQARHAAPRRLLRPHAAACASSSATGCSKATCSRSSARAGTTAREDGGGMILDMMCHWRYVLDNLFGEVQSVSCLGATHIPQRWDEAGQPYAATADDAAYATCS